MTFVLVEYLPILIFFVIAGAMAVAILGASYIIAPHQTAAFTFMRRGPLGRAPRCLDTPQAVKYTGIARERVETGGVAQSG